MGFFDKFLNAIKLNDDDFDDEDFLDDEDDAYDDEDEYEEKSKVRGRFFGRFRQDDDDYDDEDEDDDDLEDLRRRSSRTKTKAAERSSSRTSGRTARASAERSSKARTSASSVKDHTSSERPARTGAKTASSSYSASKESTTRSAAARNRKVTPIRKRSAQPATGMEVSVIRPSSMEDTREIADTLMDSCTVILNLEGLDFDIAQRVIDFACGVCYSLRGNLQKVSGYIFILTPPDVDISGDYQSILDGVFDLPSLKLSY